MTITLNWYDSGNALNALGIIPSDESTREMEVMGNHILTLHFDLPTFEDIPVGAWCTFEGQRYELLAPMTFAKNGNRKWAYTLVMEAPSGNLSKWKVRNPADGSLEFPYTATPTQHIELLVAILNSHKAEGGAVWRVGTCVDAAEKLINYNHTQLSDALAELASLFETEWEVTTENEGSTQYNTLHLYKVEHYKDNPISLAYGREGGFLPGIKRENNDKPSVERLFTQGTEENISSAHYKPLGGEVGSRRLLLPLGQELGFDGAYYSDEVGYDRAKGKVFRTSNDGQSITLAGNEGTKGNEDSLDCSDIVPAKVLVVEAVETEKAVDSEGEEYNEYNLILSINAGEDYRTYQVDGEVPYIVFQSGILAGREFDLHTTPDGTLDIEKAYNGDNFVGWRFKLVAEEQDGYRMPSKLWAPAIGDNIKVFGIQLPESAICDNTTKSGASWDMFREGVRVMWERSVKSTYYEGEISTSWIERNWATVGGKICAGGYVRLTDPAFEKEGVLIRITAVKTYINNSHAPRLTLSNEVEGRSVRTQIEQIKGEEVTVENVKRQARNFTKRRFRDAQEAQAMLGAALLGEFTETLSPIAVNTMQAIFGSTSLQYTFVESLESITPTTYLPTLDTEKITLPEAYIRHETIGIKEVKPERTYAEYRRWHVEPNVLAFEDSDKAYYIYIRAYKNSLTATFVLSSEAIALDAEAGYYHLLLATIGKVSDGTRSYQSWNGFTEVTPGAIRANRFVSTDGEQYVDFSSKEFRVGDATKWVRYANGELEVEGALIGESVLGREIKVLDERGNTTAGMSGNENAPLIYGALRPEVFYQWAPAAGSTGGYYYTLNSPEVMEEGDSVAIYNAPQIGGSVSTATYYGDGVLKISSEYYNPTGEVVVNKAMPTEARYQLLPSGVQMIGTPEGRRIEIQPTQETAAIVVYDESGNPRATISDATYNSISSIVPSATTFAIGKINGPFISSLVSNTTINEYSVEFYASQAGSLRIPSLSLYHYFNTSGTFPEYDGETTVQTQLWCYVDGVRLYSAEQYDIIDAIGLTSQTRTTSAFSVSVPQGRHTLKLELRRKFVSSPTSYMTSSCQVTAAASATIDYGGYKCSIFSNGIAAIKDSSNMLVALETSQGMEIRAQVNGAGVEVSNEGLSVRVSDAWYSISVNGDGSLKATPK